MNFCNEVIALEINGRFFYKFGCKGQVLTAWSIVAARFFTQRPDAVAMMKRLTKLGKVCALRRVRIEVVS